MRVERCGDGHRTRGRHNNLKDKNGDVGIETKEPTKTSKDKLYRTVFKLI